MLNKLRVRSTAEIDHSKIPDLAAYIMQIPKRPFTKLAADLADSLTQWSEWISDTGVNEKTMYATKLRELIAAYRNLLLDIPRRVIEQSALDDETSSHGNTLADGFIYIVGLAG